ncbi:MAG: hypothetical protein LBB59_01305 [Campylobacteraceae bacterium]|jgi:type I restriction enzyme S subunit|nr:hypothetical protein [Campylobacteraceae bacterium]
MAKIANSIANTNTLTALLNALSFTEAKTNLYTKTINNHELRVDFSNEVIIYPKSIKVNDTTTCNFSHEENFVVLECVCRLLEKGYQPNHIELEPRWKLGREAKSEKPIFK